MFEREDSVESQGREQKRPNVSESEMIDELDTKDENEEVITELDALTGLADIPIPTELDDYIRKGFAKGIKAQKTQQFRKWSTLVACFLLVVLITSARVSPAVAAVLRQIPGLGYIVELINHDKGLQSAVENDFMLPLGISDEHENIVFTVDGIIMDEASLVIFYTMENKRGYGIVNSPYVELFDDMGEPLKQVAISSSSSGNPDPDGDGKIHAQINVIFNDQTVIPNKLAMKVKLHEGVQNEPPKSSTQLSATWEVTIPVDKEKFAGMKTTYDIDQSVVIEGQKITFQKVTIYPTRSVLNVSYDPENKKKIFYFDDLTLVNEKGEEWVQSFSFEFTDARGNSFNIGEASSISHYEKLGFDQLYRVTLPDNVDYQSPITFQIEDYPSRIMGEFKIPIK